jgi:hypothetical protein
VLGTVEIVLVTENASRFVSPLLPKKSHGSQNFLALLSGFLTRWPCWGGGQRAA